MKLKLGIKFWIKRIEFALIFSLMPIYALSLILRNYGFLILFAVEIVLIFLLLLIWIKIYNFKKDLCNKENRIKIYSFFSNTDISKAFYSDTVTWLWWDLKQLFHTENYNDEYPGKYYIQYIINYLVKNHNSTTDEYYFDKSQGEYFKYTSSPSAPQICQSDAAGGPNTLLIFYATLKDMSENATSPNAKVLNDANQKETIVFKKLIPGEMKLYTFISNVDLSNPTNYNSSTMRFNVQNESSSSGISGDVQIYCSVTPDKVTLDSTEIAMLGTYNNTSANGDFSTISNITEKKSGKKMYDVTVEIYDTNDVKRASKTSTIIE